MVAHASPKTYSLRGVVVRAKDLIDGILVDPVLPEGFDDTNNQDRPHEHAVWWGVPFIVPYRPALPEAGFLKEFPAGVAFDLRCLDGGAWDRSTWWGRFATVEAAVAFAKQKPAYTVHPVADFD